MAVVGTLGALGTIAPFSIDLYLPALPALGTRPRRVAAAGRGARSRCSSSAWRSDRCRPGSLSDTYGRRRPLLAGLLLFTVASVLCAVAPNVQVLLAARFLQGLGGAAGMAISNASVTDYARGREAARLLSRLAMIGGVAPIIAPLIGGQLLRVVSWRGLFVVLAAIGARAVRLRARRPPREPAARAPVARPASAPSSGASSRSAATSGSWGSRSPARSASPGSSPTWPARRSSTRRCTASRRRRSACCSPSTPSACSGRTT